MKHSVSQRPRPVGVELVQAVCTLMVLTGIYMYSSNYANSTTASLRDIPAKPAILSSQYWNEKIGYGFSSIAGDIYANEIGSGGVDQITVRPGDWLVYDDSSVKVSFYTNVSIGDLEKQHTTDMPRTYSRLPHGIAMIEWDLSSVRAKTVLATLHSR